jgi:hypothetical protein
MRRNKLLLMILGVVLLLAIIYAYQTTPVQQHAEMTVSKQPAAHRPAAGQETEPTSEQKLQLELLERNDVVSAAVKRDIFNFYVKPVVVKPPPPPKPVAPPPPPVVRSIPVAMPQVVPPSLKYLGQLEKEGQQLFFLAQDEEVVVVRIGQRFGKQNQYSIKSYDGEKLLIHQGADLPELRLQVADQGDRAIRQSETQAGPSQPSGEGQDPFGFPGGRPRLKSFKLRGPYGNRN